MPSPSNRTDPLKSRTPPDSGARTPSFTKALPLIDSEPPEISSELAALTVSAAEARRRLPLPPERLTALGVLAALLSGLPGVIAGQPFLTHLWFSVPLAVTELPLSTVIVFDLGVYLAVWGAVGGFCLSLLAMVEEQE